ncbi:LysM peptidoglycan-binding domain-containing protein [bacterium]|nr:MAG: LysM peptidoglycan-binding domain-containing protein [bacterium]
MSLATLLFRMGKNRARNKSIFLIFFLSVCLSNLVGCTTIGYLKTPTPGVPGIYHRIESGQTLWRISQIYNVDLNELARINRIEDATNITTGQLIFIPRGNQTSLIPRKYSGEDFVWPIKGRVISSYGATSNNMVNKGINILPYSNQDVVAARSGKVVFCSENFQGYGKTIIIEHSGGFLTVYSSNRRIFTKPGEWMQKGTRIAEVNLESEKNNNYLHFEIRKGHLSQNPLFYLPR